jgi:ABC-2 type transport system permease protein
MVTGLVAIAAASALLLVVAAPTYGVPSTHQFVRVGAATVLGSVAFVSLGVLLGGLLPSARSAQAVGMALFFPSFLLGAGGPPPNALGSALRNIAGYLPLTRVTDAIRAPWLGTGNATGSLEIVAVLAVAATAFALRRSALAPTTR